MRKRGGEKVARERGVEGGERKGQSGRGGSEGGVIIKLGSLLCRVFAKHALCSTWEAKVAPAIFCGPEARVSLRGLPSLCLRKEVKIREEGGSPSRTRK